MIKQVLNGRPVIAFRAEAERPRHYINGKLHKVTPYLNIELGRALGYYPVGDGRISYQCSKVAVKGLSQLTFPNVATAAGNLKRKVDLQSLRISYSGNTLVY